MERDKDIPALLPLLAARRRCAVGFIGSDTYSELDSSVQQTVAFCRIAITGLRMALAARRECSELVAEKLSRGSTLTVATSYPAAVAEWAEASQTNFQVVALKGGSVESSCALLPDIDGIVDIVKSGRTLDANGLVAVAYRPQPISLGMVYAADPG